MKIVTATIPALLITTACGFVVSFDEYDPEGKLSRWRVLGTARGLESATARLRLGDEELVVREGPFAFETPLESGASYAVVLREEPSAYACRLENGSGRIERANVHATLDCVARSTELQLLAVHEATLFPSFTPATRSYSSSVRAPGIFTTEAPSARIVAVPARLGAKSFVRGIELAPGVVSPPIPMTPPRSSIDVEVVAPSGDRGHYTIDVAVRSADYLKPSNTRTEARFGASLAYERDLLVVGSPGDRSPSKDPFATSSKAHGAAYVFQQAVDGAWRELARLKPDTASDPAFDPTPLGAFFGTSVALSTERVVVGAPGEGAVYLFPFGGAKTVNGKLTRGDVGPTHDFGRAVAIDGTTIAVGAPDEPGENGAPSVGAVYVFSSNEGWWPKTAELRPPIDGWCRFGAAVAVSGPTIAVGAPDCDGPGKVLVYRRENDEWTLEKTFSGPLGSSMPRFGSAVTVVGDLMLVGRVEAQARGQEQTAYVYRRVQGTWTQTSTLTPWSPTETMGFGIGIAMHDDVVAISSTHSTAVFLFRHDGTQWSPHLKVDPRPAVDAYANPYDSYTSVATSLRHLAIGDSRDASSAVGVNGQHDELAPGSGAVWVY